MFLVQCKVRPEDAKERYTARKSLHPGVDLSRKKVAERAVKYPYCSEGIVVSTEQPVRECADGIIAYLSRESPIKLGVWSLSARG